MLSSRVDLAGLLSAPTGAKIAGSTRGARRISPQLDIADIVYYYSNNMYLSSFAAAHIYMCVRHP